MRKQPRLTTVQMWGKILMRKDVDHPHASGFAINPTGIRP